MPPTVTRRTGQWLPTWTLSAFVATVVFAVVLSAMSTPLAEQTGFTMVDLQLSGAYPLLAWTGRGAAPTDTILAKWKDKGLIVQAKRNQVVDFVFPLAYGTFAWLLAVGLRRLHPIDLPGGRWVWGVAAGAGAALLDACENVCLWIVLQNVSDPGMFPALASGAAVVKMALLAVAIVTFLVAVFRARA